MKSKILAKKNRLISDPVVRDMNSTQWAFEYLSYIEEQDKRYNEIETLADLVRSGVINLLGLNIVPIEEETDGIKRLRPPEDHEFTPLATLLASPEMLKAVMDKHNELAMQKQVDTDLAKEKDVLTAEDIDEQLADIEFMESAEDLLKKAAWSSPRAKEMRKLLIGNLDDQPSIDEQLREPDSRELYNRKEAKRLLKPKLVID